MAQTPSTMRSLGSPAPDFTLEDAAGGGTVSRGDFAGRPLLVMFICNHCPFVVHVRREFARIEADYAPRGLAIVAINSNSERSHPQDGPAHMAALARAEGWGFPFLFDRTQAVAKAYRAACTPDFFLFDAAHHLAYRGQLDGSRPGNSVPTTGADLRAAIETVLAGGRPDENQAPSIGCNIKWERGNEPDYFG